MTMQVLIVVVPLVVIYDRGTRAVDRADLESFAREHELQITAANGAAVLAYLARGRYYRTIGAVAGYLMAVFIGLMQGSQWPVIGFLLGLAGYFAGAFATEVALARQRSVRGTASLVPRTVDDYVDTWAVRWPLRVLAVAVAVTAIHAFAAPRTLWLAAVLCAVIAGFAAVVRASLMYVASRPQSLESPDLLAADEAIRSASSHVLAATGLAVMCLLAAIELWALAGALPSAVAVIPAAAGVALLGFAIGAWRDLPRTRFTVRRLA